MKTFVLHDTDLDGMGAKYAAWKEFGEDAEYVPLDYQDARDRPPLEKLPDERAQVFVLDYSWGVDQLYDLAAVHDVTVIDHHKSFAEELIERHASFTDALEQDPDITKQSFQAQFAQDSGDAEANTFLAVYDADRSAAALTWMFFHQSEVPVLLQHIEDRDLWKWEMGQTDAVLKGLEAKGLGPSVLDVYAHKPEDLVPTGRAICRYRDGLVDRIAENVTISEQTNLLGEEDTTVALADTPVLRSKVGHQILRENPEVEVALLFSLSDFSDATVFCSLRSRDEGPDVSEIAERFGGGGHENAAGFKIEHMTIASHEIVQAVKNVKAQKTQN